MKKYRHAHTAAEICAHSTYLRWPTTSCVTSQDFVIGLLLFWIGFLCLCVIIRIVLEHRRFSPAYSSYRDSRYKLQDEKNDNFFKVQGIGRGRRHSPLVLSSYSFHFCEMYELNRALLRIIDLKCIRHISLVSGMSWANMLAVSGPKQSLLTWYHLL